MTASDTLTEMHLLLREHGFEPELAFPQGDAVWLWTCPGRDYPEIGTWRGDDGRVEWYVPELYAELGTTIASLKRKLKQLDRARVA